MNRHKFAVGQIVDFDTRISAAPRSSGPYQVVRVLPAEEANARTYRIKSKSEPFERSAKEHEIVAVGSAPTERAANSTHWLDADPARRQPPSRPSRSR